VHVVHVDGGVRLRVQVHEGATGVVLRRQLEAQAGVPFDHQASGALSKPRAVQTDAA
jgi:hypothetical protein